jgi:SAM-dependent methyltransferase
MGAGQGGEVVRRGYNALSYRYRTDDADDGQYAPWLAELHARLPPSAAVLDLGCGCGCGVPVARSLAAAGHLVTGVDISEVQINRARRLVPTGTFLRADATDLDLPGGSFRRGCLPLRVDPHAAGRAARPDRPRRRLAAAFSFVPRCHGLPGWAKYTPSCSSGAI